MADQRIFVGFSSHNPKGNTTLYDAELINQDLRNHFHTRRGERVMLPKFGTIIWDLLFEPFTENLKDIIMEDVRGVVMSDSRVELMNMNISEFSYGLKIELQLKYRPYNSIGNFTVNFDKRSAARS